MNIDHMLGEITDLITNDNKILAPIHSLPRRFQLPRLIINLVKQCIQLRRAFQGTQNADIKTRHDNVNKKVAELICKKDQ